MPLTSLSADDPMLARSLARFTPKTRTVLHRAAATASPILIPYACLLSHDRARNAAELAVAMILSVSPTTYTTSLVRACMRACGCSPIRSTRDIDTRPRARLLDLNLDGFGGE